jgi:RHS repeat-associated protein
LSTRVVLNTSGNVLGRQAHLPYGEDFGESGTQEKHHFTSYERDGEAVADYAVNRQYSPGIGRFSRPDPYGGSNGISNPQSLNRYAYVQNDPMNEIDPLGLFQFCIWRVTEYGLESYCGNIDDPESGGGDSVSGGAKSAPKPRPFSEKTLKKCLDTLFGVTMTSFQRAKNGSNGTFTGTGPDRVPPHTGNNENIEVTIDATHTGADLGAMWTARHPGDPAGNLRGVYLHDLSYSAFVASNLDTFSKKPSIAVQVHELGNALAYITGTASDPTTPNFENNDTDSGVRLERCVFGGTFNNNGRFVPSP